MNKLRSACAQINPSYKPAITFVVVQKRHHTRFFPANRKDEVLLTSDSTFFFKDEIILYLYCNSSLAELRTCRQVRSWTRVWSQRTCLITFYARTWAFK
jgi:hypothetical protein